uniref:24 kDa family member n=1 Tax=Rhipicephalus zambeziensis TaxID=60191 RepID=A0A224YG57_9ACAR
MKMWKATAFLFVTTYIGVCRSQLKPGCEKAELHACGEDYMVYSNRTRMPEPDEPEFEAICELFREQVACTLNFAQRCLQDGIPRVVALVSMEAAGEDFEAACTEGTDEHELLRNSVKCMNAVGTKLNRCFDGLRDGLGESLASSQGIRTIHYACCTYNTFLDCIERSLDGCEPGSKAKDYLNIVMDRTYGQMLSLVCGRYTRGSTHCLDLPKLPPYMGPKQNLIDMFIEIARAFKNVNI